MRKPKCETVRPHPELWEQEKAMQAALSRVTEDSVAALLKCNNMSLVHFALWPENNPDVPGRLFNNNAIFTVTAKKDRNHVELVLRILNCHAWRRGRNGQSEVATLKWLEMHSMPLTPRVIDFAVDAASSPLGCEFILMEKLPGIQLRRIWAQVEESQRVLYLQQLKDWLRQLHEIPRPPGHGPLASLRLADSSKILADRPIVLVDGPALPETSRRGFAEYAKSIIEDACSRLPASELKEALEKVIHVDLREYAKNYEENGQGLVPSECLRLCHNDLNLGNILCDSEKITGIVDWEGACWGFTDQDVLDFQSLAVDAADGLMEECVTAPGHRERRRLMELLRELPGKEDQSVEDVWEITKTAALWKIMFFVWPFGILNVVLQPTPWNSKLAGLYFFNATWYGALADASEREVASLEEGKSAEQAVWQWFQRKHESLSWPPPLLLWKESEEVKEMAHGPNRKVFRFLQTNTAAAKAPKKISVTCSLLDPR